MQNLCIQMVIHKTAHGSTALCEQCGLWIELRFVKNKFVRLGECAVDIRQKFAVVGFGAEHGNFHGNPSGLLTVLAGVYAECYFELLIAVKALSISSANSASNSL